MNIATYNLVYHITIIPEVIFAGITTCNEPFHFTRLEVPSHLKANPIECRFTIFSPEGDLIEMCNEYTTYATLVSIANIVPLKMIEKLTRR